MKDIFLPFIPAEPLRNPSPLSRFLPPLPPGMFSAWLREHTPRGSWLLDPFGSTPFMALEAAQEGYRILVASNNPVLTFMLETLAEAPSASEMNASLAELSRLRSGDERLESQLRAIYLTECPSCGAMVEADSFLWRKGENYPFAKIVNCTQCGFQAEAPIVSGDISRLQHIGKDSLHRSRAIFHFEKEDNKIRESASEAVESYLPRALFFIFSLINKINTPSLPKPHQRNLTALLLNTLDEGNSLWTYPAARSRPRQLFTPPQFRENNLWHALESSIAWWTVFPHKTPVTRYPELPPETGGVCLFPGRLRALFPLQISLPIKTCLMVVPRPNQAFWTLSALWSAWLWGKEASFNLMSSLERRRYDWIWFTGAINQTMNIITKNLDPNIEAFAVIPEIEPGFLTSMMLGSLGANFQLKGVALRQEQETIQLLWSRKSPSTSYEKSGVEKFDLAEGLKQFLSSRNEPAPYSMLFAHALTQKAVSGKISIQAIQQGKNIFKEITSEIDSVFSIPNFWIRYNHVSESLDSGVWWLKDPINVEEMTLSDRVELRVVQILQSRPSVTLLDMDRLICKEFPGFSTPSLELIQTILESYGEAVVGVPKCWQPKTQEYPHYREQDVLLSQKQIAQIGARMGFTTTGERPILWLDKNGEKQYLFFVMTSSLMSRYVFTRYDVDEKKCVLVFPGSRSRLIAYKLKNDPRLLEAVNRGWHFLKLRHLARIHQYSSISPQLWDQLLDGDPPREDETQQIFMFGKN